MSFTRPHHHARIVAHNHDWERSVRCTIILKSLALAAFLFGLAAAPAYSAEIKTIPLKSSMTSKQASTGQASPCVPPHITRTDKRDHIAQAANRSQRNAVSSPSMSYAMALSIALGLRNATGPVMKSSKDTDKQISRTSARTRAAEQSRTLTACANPARCSEQISMR